MVMHPRLKPCVSNSNVLSGLFGTRPCVYVFSSSNSASSNISNITCFPYIVSSTHIYTSTHKHRSCQGPKVLKYTHQFQKHFPPIIDPAVLRATWQALVLRIQPTSREESRRQARAANRRLQVPKRMRPERKSPEVPRTQRK